MTETPAPTCLRSAPVLQVADVRRSEAFYRDKLGFVSHGVWGDPPGFCAVARAEKKGRQALAGDRERVEEEGGEDPDLPDGLVHGPGLCTDAGGGARRQQEKQGQQAGSDEEVAADLEVSLDALNKRWQRLMERIRRSGLPFDDEGATDGTQP